MEEIKFVKCEYKVDISSQLYNPNIAISEEMIEKIKERMMRSIERQFTHYYEDSLNIRKY